MNIKETDKEVKRAIRSAPWVCVATIGGFAYVHVSKAEALRLINDNPDCFSAFIHSDQVVIDMRY